MRYELDLIYELCCEIGLSARMVAGRLRYAPYAGCQRVEVDLGQGAVLCFQNSDHEPDCLIGFLTLGPSGGANDNRSAEGYEFTGVDWHTHFDNLTFTDARGYYVKLDYLDLLVGLKEGRVLICEREVETADRWRWPTRWLTHTGPERLRQCLRSILFARTFAHHHGLDQVKHKTVNASRHDI